MRNGDETVVWELLSDIESEYSANKVIHGAGRRRKNHKTKKSTKMQKNTIRKKKQQQQMANKRKNGTSNLNSTNSTSYLEETFVQGTPERKQGGASFNTGSTLRSGQRGRTSLSAGMSRNGDVSQIRSFTTTARKPFGLLDPEHSGSTMHGVEHDGYGMEDDRIAGGFSRSSRSSGRSSNQRRRRQRQMSTTER